jgi:hypothetical protein
MKASPLTTASSIATLAVSVLLLEGCAAGTSESEGTVVLLPEDEITVEVFTADDLDESVGPTIEATLLAASEHWGLYWPVEYWVMGLDPDAGQALVEQYCQRRDEARQFAWSDCMARETGDEENSMISYQRQGAEALAKGQPLGTAGRNGDAGWGLHRFTSSIPWGLTGYFELPGEGELKTVIHEYWHAVQHSFIQTLDRDRRKELMGPVWFVEGSAEYMAQIGRVALRAEDKLPEVPAGAGSFEFEEQMSGKLFSIGEALSGDCEGRVLTSITDYSDPCSNLGYDAGAWAIAYLLDETDDKTLLADFYPTLEKKGWQLAFEDFAGMSLAQFNEGFTKFIDKTTAERLAILPSF